MLEEPNLGQTENCGSKGCNTAHITPHHWVTCGKKEKRKRKVYAVGRHIGSLCSQKQPETYIMFGLGSGVNSTDIASTAIHTPGKSIAVLSYFSVAALLGV